MTSLHEISLAILSCSFMKFTIKARYFMLLYNFSVLDNSTGRNIANVCSSNGSASFVYPRWPGCSFNSFCKICTFSTQIFCSDGPQGALSGTKLLRPFSEILDSLGLKDPFIRNWVDLLSFLLAGVKSNGVLSAEMVIDCSSS